MSTQDIIVAAGWIAGILCSISAVYWLFAVVYIWLGLRSTLKLSDGLSAGLANSERPLVSIIMPAHNEEGMINEALTALLRSSYVNLEVIVVADRCNDGTVEIIKKHQATDDRLSLIELDMCPDDWAGKCHAAWHGAKAAKGDWLLFTDADTIFGKDLVTAALGLAVSNKLDLLTLLGNLSSTQAFEKTAQPVAAMTLMTIFPLQRANRKESKRRRPFANGQFLLFRADTYNKIGTHERVRQALLEDLLFALLLKKGDYAVAVTLGGEMFRVRMYASAQAFCTGWLRIFTEAANRNIRRLRKHVWRLRVQAFMPLLFWGSLIFGISLLLVDRDLAICTIILALSAQVCQLGALSLAYRAAGTSVRSIWRHPAGCLAVSAIITESIRYLQQQQGINWADRHYDIEQKIEQ